MRHSCDHAASSLHPASARILQPLALAVMLAGTSQSFAASYQSEDGRSSARISSSLSAGVSVSTANPDKDLLPTAYGGHAGGINGNDGRQNFKAGDAISRIIKGSTEVALTHDNMGLFVRGKYWYDDALKNGEGRFKEFDDSGFDPLAKFSGAALMDAYAWGEFELGERMLDVRLGRQVLSWGESTFIQGGINIINPVDVNAITRPGVEIKEALLPVNMLSLSLGLSENLSASAFYQLQWRSSVLPGCGTFFAQSDAVQPGCGPLYAVSGLTEEQQENMSLVNPALPASANMVLNRQADDNATNHGQWGMRLNYFAEALNFTEFGFYMLNYHSRLPFTAATTADYDDRPGSGFFLNGITNNPAYGNASIPFVQGPEYQVVYPENIRLYGLSFNTSGPMGVSLAGEVSHRPDMPIAINGQDFLYASGFLDTESPIVDELFDLNIVQPGSGPILARNAGLYGKKVDGFRRKPVSQAQVTAIHSSSDIFGAENMLLIAEAGAVHIGDLEDKDVIKYGRNALYSSGVEGAAIACKNPQLKEEYCTLNGYTSRWSWGYAMKAALTYSNVFRGTNLTPSIAWRHDVRGYAAAPAPQFIEGRRAVTAALAVDYQGRYNAALSYTDYFGGDFNAQTDRDFASFTIGAKF